jgi:phospholipid/cholesterol/gamma-HCH transport system substrate-binding protein
MSERRQKLRLGLFVLITLGLLGALIIVFGGAPGWFKPTHQYTILFTDAPGVTPGTPVRKSGVKVGEVSAVELDDATAQVRVTVRLDAKFTPRANEEPTVTRGLIVGETAIDFIPRPDKAVADRIPPGSTIQGVSPFNAQVLLDQATGLVPDVKNSLVQIRRSLEAVEKVTPQVGTTMKQVGDLAQASKEFIPDLRRTNDSLRELLAGSGEVGPALKNFIPELVKTNDEIRVFLKTASFWVEDVGVMLKKNEPRIVNAVDALTLTTQRIGDVFNPENQKAIADTLKRLDRISLQTEDLMKDAKTAMKSLNTTLAQADQALGEIRQATRPFAERSGRILQNLEASSEQFARTMVDVRKLVDAIGRSEGAFQKFITDPALYNNLNETAVMLNKLMPRMDRILKDVEVFADKIARHPEAIGIGGAIRPSSGLKESPSSPVSKPHNP